MRASSLLRPLHPAIARAAVFAAVGSVSLFSTTAAKADVEHVIGKGHTLQAIANRYHVSVKSIMEANHIKDAKHLKIGDTLTIPKAEAPKKDDKTALGTSAKPTDKDHDKAKVAVKDDKLAGKDAKAEKSKDKDADKAKTPGVIHLKRFGTTEEADLRLTDSHSGKISASTSKSVEKMLRFPGGASHPIDARLISLLGVVSNHFGSRKIEVISGFRPYTPTQYTPHSNHNHGKAVDFHIAGVPNEQVRDFCRTLKNTGCGYYPNSTFVHMDVRDASSFWIDYSKPGEPPRYNTPNVDADEGTSDVHGDVVKPSANTQPAPPSNDEGGSVNESDPPPATKPSDD